MSGIERDGSAPENPSLASELMLDEPSTSLAWRILTSGRTFLVLTGLVGTFFAIAAFLPQRPLPDELARTLPFASAEVARDLGLTDALTAWPTTLLLLLLSLNAIGLVLGARTTTRSSSPNRIERLLPEGLDTLQPRLDTLRPRLELGPNASIIARGGLFREGLGLALVGLLTLLGALIVSRTASTEARLSLVPGSPAPSEAKLRDGDLMLLASLPWGLMCDKPDPQDPLRRFSCRMADRGTPPSDLTLQPGERTHLGDFSLTPVRERLRVPAADAPIDLLLLRNGQPERLRITPGKRLALTSGEHLTAFHGPDGPLVIAESAHGQSLLVPRSTLGPHTSPLPFSVEAEHATVLEVDVTTSPERPLFLTGLALLLLGLLLMALVPHFHLELLPVSQGTLVIASSLNRPNLPSRLLDTLLSSRKTNISIFEHFRPNLPSLLGQALALAGLVLGLDHLSGPALPLALGTILAFPTRASLLLGSLTLIAGLGSSPHPLASPTDLILPLGLGACLGLLARQCSADTHFRGRHELAGGLAALVLALLLALPLPHLSLVTPDGSPLSLPAILGDGATTIRTSWPLSPFVEAPTSSLNILAAVAALLGAVFLFATHLAPSQRLLTRTNAARIGILCGALGVAAGLAGYFSLLSAPELTAATLRQTFDLAASRDGAVLALDLPAHALDFSSRPFVDGLRLLAGLTLVALFIVRRNEPSAPSTTPLGPTLYLALALGTLGLLGASTTAMGFSGSPLLLLGGLTFVLGAAVGTARLAHAPLAPRVALLTGTLMVALGPLLPLLYGA